MKLTGVILPGIKDLGFFCCFVGFFLGFLYSRVRDKKRSTKKTKRKSLSVYIEGEKK